MTSPDCSGIELGAMAPDRGGEASSSSSGEDVYVETPSRQNTQLHRASTSLDLTHSRSDLGLYATPSHTRMDADADGNSKSALDGTNFTWRGVVCGTLIGIIICFSNTYFGLQTGWISGMTMPASLIGFAVFKSLRRFLVLPFTPVENVLVQTVAGAVGTMPLGCGFVGVMPALEFLLKKGEGGRPVPGIPGGKHNGQYGLQLEFWRLAVWAIGICLFGVVFAVPLRKQVIVREKLKFPSGTATALMIGVLHGGAGQGERKEAREQERADEIRTTGAEERDALLRQNEHDDNVEDDVKKATENEDDLRADWKAQIRMLLIAFGISAVYTLATYFIPHLRNIPIFGSYLATTWLWALNPSPAYVGQGIIMGPATTVHMLLGAIIGWAILSPLAKQKGWADGPVSDWETGSKGWIVWISLAIMLADAVINLGWLVAQPLWDSTPYLIDSTVERWKSSNSWRELLFGHSDSGYSAISGRPHINSMATSNSKQTFSEPPDDAPPHHLISNTTVWILLPVSVAFCVLCIHITFGAYIPLRLSILSVFIAMLLSVMGVRALGETDLNPVSGISKLTQLIFALFVPRDGTHGGHGIIINLIAGAVSESGALQAGDLMQDLKAGHLIGASPKAQFYGQVIGSVVGAVVSAAVYKLYVHVYNVPGELFQVPTAYVWVFTARLVTGKGLPPMAWQYSLAFGLAWVILTMIRIFFGRDPGGRPGLYKFQPYVPGGIAVAVGMYNTPSFTLARTAGGLVSWWWTRWKGKSETKVIVLASGLILGEGVVSIINLILASAGVPHL